MTGDEDELTWELGAAKAWLREKSEQANRIPDYDPKIVLYIHAAAGLHELLDVAGDRLSLDQINALMALMGRPQTPHS